MLSAAKRVSGAVNRRLFSEGWAGECPICEAPTRFVVEGRWYRDQLKCAKCRSLPRERALMSVLTSLYPDWRSLDIHESSPCDRGASRVFKSKCAKYTASQYDPHTPAGSRSDGYISQDLENQTFLDDAFDLVVTQDVFEHLPHPDRAISEIARTLRVGGAHIMTVPIVRREQRSRRRAELRPDGTMRHILDPEYHGNPMSDEGSLVTVDWGYDIADYLTFHSGLPTTLHRIEDRIRGILGEYLEVVVSRKSAVPKLN